MNGASDVRVHLVAVLILSLLFLLNRAAGKLAPRVAIAPLLFLVSRKPVLAAWAAGALGMLALLVPPALAKGNDAPGDFLMMGALGVFCGLGFAVLAVGPFFMAARALGQAPVFPIDEGEGVLHERLANHFLGGEARGGKLIVTTRRVGFLSHRFNVQLDAWTVALEDIVSMKQEGERFLLVGTRASKEPEWIVTEKPDAVAAYIRALQEQAEPDRAGANDGALRAAGLGR